MSEFCQDRDLLGVEPVVFIGGGFPAQQLITGSDGALSGTTFTSASSNFSTAQVVPGMVLCVYTTTAAEGSALEIVSADSATTLTVSVLRAETDDSPIAPPAGSGLMFHLRTYHAQIKNVSDALAEKLRQITEVAGISQADFADSRQLRMTSAYGCLASLFVARADNATAADANWIKAEHYRQEFRKHQTQLRLVVDTDGNGHADQTRTLGNVMLRRR